MPIAILALVWSPSALACSLVGPEALAIDAALADGQRPEAPNVDVVEVTRGRGPRGGMASSCDDLGGIEVRLGEAPEGVGYRVVLDDGDLPDGLGLAAEPVLARDDRLAFHWVDGATDDQEPLSFALLVTAVDAGGEESEPVVVEVEDPGATPTGCDTTGGVGSGALGLALLAATRRRREVPRSHAGR